MYNLIFDSNYGALRRSYELGDYDHCLKCLDMMREYMVNDYDRFVVSFCEDMLNRKGYNNNDTNKPRLSI